MRILFLTPELPYPPRSGGTIKSMSVLAHLRREHSVEVACLTRAPLSERQSAWAREMGVVAAVRLSRPRSAANLLRSYAGRVPLSIHRNHSERLANLVSERVAGAGYDAVFADGWLMAQYVPRSFRGLRMLHQHNAEHVMWRRQAELEANPARRALVGAEYRRVRSYERSILGEFDAVFAVSEPDRRAMVDLGAPKEAVRLLPNIPRPELLERPALSFEQSEPALLYLGTLDWPPNLEGLRRFLRRGYPEVVRRSPQVRFLIAGSGAPPGLLRLAAAARGVEMTGPPADEEVLYRRARAFVEVTRGGSGTRLKVLNALARGLPVVTTPDGAEGLETVPGRHLLVAAEPGDFADAVQRALTDPERWKALSENGRELIARRYVAEVAFRALDEVIGAPSAGR